MKTKPVVTLLLSALACAALRAAPICDFMGCKFGSQSPSVAGITNALGSAYSEWREREGGMSPLTIAQWSARKNTGESLTVDLTRTRRNRLYRIRLEWVYPVHDDATRKVIEADAASLANDLSVQYGITLSPFDAKDDNAIARLNYYDETNDVSVRGAIDSTCGSDVWYLRLRVIRRDIEAADNL